MASYANPQSLNRYSYVTNNPLRYTDPTGHKETECASQNDPLCSGVNGGSTGNTNAGGGNGNGKNKDKHGNDPGGDILGNGGNAGQQSIPTVAISQTSEPEGPNWTVIIGTTVLIIGGALILATGFGVVAYGGLMVYAGAMEIIEGAVGLAAIEACQGIAWGALFTIPSGLAGMWIGGKTLQAATSYSP